MTLGDVAKWGSGGTPKARDPRYYENGTVPWAVIGDLNDGIVRETAAAITIDALNESSAKLIPRGSILVAMYGSIGKLGIAASEMASNQAIAFAVPNDELICSKFLFWYLRSQRAELTSAGKGATQQNISQTILKSWPIPVPPLDEQRRIVATLEDHLSRIEVANNLLDAANARTLRMVEAAEVAALDRPDLPLGWGRLTIADMAEVGSGATPLKSRTDFYERGTIPWVTSGDLNQPLVTEPKGRITEVALHQSAVKLWPAGTLLVAMYGEGKTRGRSAELGVDATTNQACAAIRLKPESGELKPWLKIYLTANYRRMRRMAAGGVQPNLSLGLIKQLVVPLPPKEDRDRVIQAVNVAHETVSFLRASIVEAKKKSRSLRRSLLHAAFSGDLR